MSSSSSTPSSSEQQQGPRMEALDRVRNLPSVQSAIEKTCSTYSYVKDSHQLIGWALGYAEAGLSYAGASAAPLAKPLAPLLDSVDQKLCQGLDSIEKRAPIVREPPAQIYEAAKNVMNSSLQPTIERLQAARDSAASQASVLRDIGVGKANELLDGQCGAVAVQGIDNTSVLVTRLLDHFFPAVEGEEPMEPPVSAEENKVLHTVQTIGQLSSKTATRVYRSVAAQLRTVRKEDVAGYMSGVVSILRLAGFLSGTENSSSTGSDGTGANGNGANGQASS